MTKTQKLLVVPIVLLLVLAAVLVYRQPRSAPAEERVRGAASTTEDQLQLLADRPMIRIQTSKGTITLRLFRDNAPALTTNFLELARKGYYDGLTFHRVVPGFVIQGGDPNGDGTGGESATGTGMADEPGALALHHARGVVAWAKTTAPNSIGSQFYIALDELPELDGVYSVFGQVTDGMDVVDAIAAVPTDAEEQPTELIVIERLRIEE